MTTPVADWTIEVVCTDRGSHARRRLTSVRKVQTHDGEIARTMPSSWGPDDAWQSWAPPMKEAEPGDSESRSSYTFTCPRCHRKVNIKASRWWEAVRRVVTETDLTEIDLSVLFS